MMHKLKNYYRDPLYKNSFYILLNSITGALFGFIFWLIAARLYSSEDVGVSIALISSIGIIVNLSSLGLNTGIIRFLPRSTEKAKLLISVWMVSIACVVIVGFIFIGGINKFSIGLKYLMNSWIIIIFILVLVFQMSSDFFGNVLLALRKPEYSYAQNLGLGIRIILLFPLTFLGVLGIFGSFGIAYFASFCMGLFVLNRMKILIKPVLKINLLNDIIHFSLANYVADFLVMAGSSILPLLILNVLGAKKAAYFYVAFSIAYFLYAIPNALFISMFVECSHGMPLRKNIIKALVAAGVIMIPIGILLYFFGDILLNLFSREYSENAFEILKLLVLSSVLVMFNSLFISVKRIQKDIKPIIMINALLFASIVIASYVFMQQYGVMGVGMGWLAGQGVAAVVTVGLAWRDRWI